MKIRGFGKVILASLLVQGLVAGGCAPSETWQNADAQVEPGQPDSGSPQPGDPDASSTPQPGTPDAGSTPQPGTPDAAATPGQPDAAPISPSATPGDACSCDSDCPAVGAHAGICVYSVCMTRASAACATAGSTGECGSGSRCWSLSGAEGYICWPDCDTYSCDGTCDGDGSCAPTAEMNCDYSCGSYCSCEPGDCSGDATCVNGQCVTSTGDGPGVGPGPECPALPARDCTGSDSYCSELVVFNPRTTANYDDYPINGETSTNQYRSYLRRDLMMLIDYASAKTLCKTAAWDTGNGGALGLGDMSEVNGAIPGTAIGSPGHPENTHTNGFDIDLGYYQINTTDNRLRPICTYADYHCTAEPHLLDVWREAFFLGTMLESNRTRVIGIDGQAGPLIDAAYTELCNTGWLSSAACSNYRLAYATTPDNSGWYYFHHHHSHVSLCSGSGPPLLRASISSARWRAAISSRPKRTRTASARPSR